MRQCAGEQTTKQIAVEKEKLKIKMHTDVGQVNEQLVGEDNGHLLRAIERVHIE